MMRIGILSDTHDKVRRTARAVDLLIARGAVALIHCGDLTGPDVVLECAALPCHYVFGNNDFEFERLEEAMRRTGGVCLGFGGVVELGGRRIAVTHGDRGAEVRRLMADGPDYLLTGHTHHATDERVGATRLINPGALHRATPYTVALLDLEADDLRPLVVEAGR